MAIFITVLLAFAFANLWRCLRFAYISARDLNSGGYPIYGDAIHNFMFIGFAAFCANKSPNWYSQYQALLAWLAVSVLIVNLWLIGRFIKAGESARQARKF